MEAFTEKVIVLIAGMILETGASSEDCAWVREEDSRVARRLSRSTAPTVAAFSNGIGSQRRLRVGLEPL
jgi:hypothetical protein